MEAQITYAATRRSGLLNAAGEQLARRFLTPLLIVPLFACSTGGGSPDMMPANCSPVGLPISADVLDQQRLFFPAAAFSAGQLIIAGNAIPSLTKPQDASRPTLALFVDGKPLQGPTGRFRFMEPRIWSKGKGAFTLVWAEPTEAVRASSAAYRWVELGAAELWTAAFDGQGWTTPQKLFTGSPGWSQTSNDSDPAAGSYIAFTTDELRGGLSVIRGDDAGVVVTTVPVRRGVSPSLTTVGDTVIVAYIAARTDVPSGMNSVFVIRSPDRGQTWGTPALLSTGGDAPASEIRVRRDSRGRVHVVWHVTTAAGGLLRHTSSTNAGLTWSHQADQSLPSAFNNPVAAVDECGSLAVYYEAYDNGRGSLRVAQWATTWQGDATVLPKYRATFPAIVFDREARALIFMADDPDSAGGVMTFVARFR